MRAGCWKTLHVRDSGAPRATIVSLGRLSALCEARTPEPDHARFNFHSLATSNGQDGSTPLVTVHRRPGTSVRTLAPHPRSSPLVIVYSRDDRRLDRRPRVDWLPARHTRDSEHSSARDGAGGPAAPASRPARPHDHGAGREHTATRTQHASVTARGVVRRVPGNVRARCRRGFHRRQSGRRVDQRRWYV
jgi:hypothetical protein